MLWSYVLNLTDIRLPCIKFLKTRMVGGGDAHMIRSGFPLVREVQKIMIVIMVKVTIFRFYFFTASSFVNDFSHYSNHSVLDTWWPPPLFQEHSTFFRIGWKSARTIVTPFGDRIFFGLEDFSLRLIWCIRDKDK